MFATSHQTQIRGNFNEKFALYFCLFVLIAGATSMCSDKDADSKKAESAAPAKTLTLADYRTVGLLNEEKVGVIKSFMKKNNLPDSELNSFQTCLVEYANFRDEKKSRRRSRHLHE